MNESDLAPDLSAPARWSPPATWLRITTIDTHTGGEPLRIITSGLPTIEGSTILEKRQFFMTHYDHLRTGLLLEPRGHADMYGAVLSPSADEADLDVFFLNTVGYSPMCGHAILAITKVVFDTGIIRRSGPCPELVINVPCGRNHAKAVIKDGCAQSISFQNVPSFVYLRDKHVEVAGLGNIPFDIAFGGCFYAIVDASSCRLSLETQHYNNIIDCGRRVKEAITANFEINHPFETSLSSLFGVIFTAPASKANHHSRNVTVFEDGEVDRSATGSGVSARAALAFAKGQLELDQEIVIESIVGSTMTVKVKEQTKFGPYDAVVPEVGGTAHITGRHEFFLDPADTYNAGFMFR